MLYEVITRNHNFSSSPFEIKLIATTRKRITVDLSFIILLVITSYSIHYTKLYDTPLFFRRERQFFIFPCRKNHFFINNQWKKTTPLQPAGNQWKNKQRRNWSSWEHPWDMARHTSSNSKRSYWCNGSAELQ